jgi:predicted DNA-binding protein
VYRVVTPEQKKALDAITDKTGVPITFTVRQALEAYLKGQKL